MNDSIGVELLKVTVGPWSLNSYALICRQTGNSVLVDPGAEPDALCEMLEGTRPIAILITHRHPDHIGALETMRARLDVPVWAGADPSHEMEPIVIDRVLVDGDEIALGSHRICVIGAPGHTADLVCYAIPSRPGEDTARMIVGDAIFRGGPGKTWSPQDFLTTLQTLKGVILPRPNNTQCYPGHGPDFRLGDIREKIEAFVQRDHGEFFGDAIWEMNAG